MMVTKPLECAGIFETLISAFAKHFLINMTQVQLRWRELLQGELANCGICDIPHRATYHTSHLVITQDEFDPNYPCKRSENSRFLLNVMAKQDSMHLLEDAFKPLA